MKKISIIIPVYNAEKYIGACIDSILKQSFTNYEIIIINDGSDDNTIEICKKIKVENPNKEIKIINKKNEGSASARNVGLKLAQGELISFVDADDYICNDFLYILYQYQEKFNADIVQCDFIRTNDKYPSSKLSSKKTVEKYTIKSSKEMMIDFCNRKTYVKTVVLWNKLFKKELFNNLIIKEGKAIDDEFIILNILLKSNKIVDIKAQLYYYYQSVNSQMRSGYSIKKIQDCVDLIDYQIAILNEHISVEYFGVYCYRICRGLMDYKYLMRYDIESSNLLYQKIKKYIKKYFPLAIKCRKVNFIEKIFLVIQRIFPGLIYNLKNNK